MNIQILSDLHFEFHRDEGRAFVDGLDPSGVDALVVAGDLAAGNYLESALTRLCERFPRVVFVAGNHEYYASSPRAVAKIKTRLKAKLPGLSWLEREVTVIEGVRFVGTTLWFRDAPESRRHRDRLNDFHQIRDFVPWVFDENRDAERFIDAVRPGDVVVTHHLPAPESIHPRYDGNPLNAFFLCDVSPLIEERQPQLWVHGHTHTSCDYMIGKTHVVCNPFGYPRYEENPGFTDCMMVNVK